MIDTFTQSWRYAGASPIGLPVKTADAQILAKAVWISPERPANRDAASGPVAPPASSSRGRSSG